MLQVSYTDIPVGRRESLRNGHVFPPEQFTHLDTRSNEQSEWVTVLTNGQLKGKQRGSMF